MKRDILRIIDDTSAIVARTHTLANIIENDLLESGDGNERCFTDKVAASVLWQVEHNLADVTSSLNELWDQCQKVLAAHGYLEGLKIPPASPGHCNATQSAMQRCASH